MVLALCVVQVVKPTVVGHVSIPIRVLHTAEAVTMHAQVHVPVEVVLQVAEL